MKHTDAELIYAFQVGMDVALFDECPKPHEDWRKARREAYEAGYKYGRIRAIELNLINIQATNRYLSFNGPPQAAFRFVQEWHELAHNSGLDFGNEFNDFLLSIENELMLQEYLDENFEPTEKLK